MYIEYLEMLADLFPIIVPVAAIVGLMAARTARFPGAQMVAESLFYLALCIVCLGAVRSMVNSDPAWLLHTASLGLLVIGGSIIAIGAHNQPQVD